MSIRANRAIVIGFVLLSFCLTASIGMASIKITWTSHTSDEVYEQDGTTPLRTNSIVQLIWSPTNPVPFTEVTPWNWTNPPDGQIILDEKASTGLGPFSGVWSFGTLTYVASNAPWYLPEDYFVNNNPQGQGWVYQRVFDVQWGNTPTQGSYYAVSTPGAVLSPLTDQDPTPATPDASYIKLPADASLFSTDLAVVPEPGTMTLFGLGLALVALKRKLRKRS